MRIGLLSDTHGFCDERLYEYFKDVDEVWHAGDIGSLSLAHQLADFKPLKAVWGNIDGTDIRSVHPEYWLLDIQGFVVLMIHIAGPMGKYNATVRKLVELHSPQMLVCGHSHILKVVFDQRYNLLYMNPGAAGNHGFHQEKTALMFNIKDGKPTDLSVVKLGKRGSVSY